ncbi:MAG TPA: hypothetical protein VEG36_15415 [Burkholderiales bacterium]|nr:hypothetical protein [Burkholderiales bacterium]
MASVAARLARRLVLLSADEALRARLEQALPETWQLSRAREIGEVGEFQDVLLHRFVLVDLDSSGALEAIAQIRGEMMLNVPIFCFGGDAAARDAARRARADRFFGRDEIAVLLPKLCEQFAW